MTYEVAPDSIPRKSVPLFVFLSIITLDIAMPVWWLRRRRWLNSLSSRRKLGYKLPLFVLVAYSISVPILFVAIFAGYLVPALGLATILLLLVSLSILSYVLTVVSSILVIVTAFKIRSILHEHSDNLGLGISSSATATFFFTFWYLQYKINRLGSGYNV